MKKKLKPLRLNRETLYTFQDQHLRRLAGGTEEIQRDTHFDHTCGTVCDIETWHCTRCSICP